MTTAQSVLQSLTQAGFPREDVSLVAGDQSGEWGRKCEPIGTKAGEGAGVGGAIGAAVGGAGGLLIGLGALVIPGLGPIVALGPILATLVGLGAGAAAGGLVGALVGTGIPEYDAACYAEGIRRGGVVVTVNAPDASASRAAEVMRRFHPVNIEERAAAWRAEGWKGPMPAPSTPSAMEKTVREGARDVGTAAADTARTAAGTAAGAAAAAGAVAKEAADKAADTARAAADTARMAADKVRMDTEAKIQKPSVSVTPPEVKVERPMVSAKPPEVKVEPPTMTGKRVETLMERPMARPEGTDMAAQGGVRVHPQAMNEPMEGMSEVYHERLEVTYTEDEAPCGVPQSTNFAGMDFSAVRPGWEQHYRAHANTYGRTFDEWMPAYRYGYMLARDGRYRDQNWSDLESMARDVWNQDRPGYGTWDQVKDAIRFGWNSAHAGSRV